MARSHEAFELAHKIHDIEVKGHQLDVRLSQAGLENSVTYHGGSFFLNDGNLPVESIRSDEGSQQLLGAAAKHHRTTRTNLGGTDFRSKLLGVERKSLELTGGCSYCLRMNQVKSKVENPFVHSDNLALD